MEQNNKNKKIEELTDEQLKKVAGGFNVSSELCLIDRCIEYAKSELCECSICDEFSVLQKQGGRMVCVQQ